MASMHPPGSTENEQETLLEFPCKFPIKAMGRHDEGFETLVTGIVLSKASPYPGAEVTTSPSSNGKYISVTVVIEAVSKDQLDSIYQDLTDCEQVLIAL